MVRRRVPQSLRSPHNADVPVDTDLEDPFLGADRSGGVPKRSRVQSGGVGGVPERRGGQRECDNE